MQLHLPTLLVALTAVMFTAACLTTFVGLTQRIYRGFWLWMAAQWLATAGLACTLWRESEPRLLPLTVLLVLQWPVVMLAGSRQFYIRTSFPTRPGTDWIVLGVAYLAWWSCYVSGAAQYPRTTVFSLGMVLVHAYAFWVGLHVREWRHSAPLRGLLGLLLLVVAVYAPRAVLGLGDWNGSAAALDHWIAPWTTLATTCGLLFALHLVMLLTNERTELGLQESQRQLRVLANTDMLTQVPNRRHFNDLAMQTLQLFAPERCAVMLFDIDHFKEINDTLGHAAGDEALRLVARSARETLRAQDVFGRLGGDEFIVLLPDTNVQDALHVADRIVLHVDAQREPGSSTELSLSFGVVQMHAGEAMDRAIRRADQALYEAKRQGRSRAVAASESDGEAVFTESRPLGLTTY